jgi:hypothetical protein
MGLNDSKTIYGCPSHYFENISDVLVFTWIFHCLNFQIGTLEVFFWFLIVIMWEVMETVMKGLYPHLPFKIHIPVCSILLNKGAYYISVWYILF